MSFRTEIEQSDLHIYRAEKRILCQRAIVKKLRFDIEPRYSEMANELLVVMEERIVAMRKRHVELLGLSDKPRQQSEMLVAK